MAVHRDRRAGESVVIDGEFVRQQAKAAVTQFFKPITAAFERSEPHASASSITAMQVTENKTLVPKPDRVEMRGYAIKRKRR